MVNESFKKKVFSSKGTLRVSIPKKIAEELKIEANEIVFVELLNDKITISKKKVG